MTKNDYHLTKNVQMTLQKLENASAYFAQLAYANPFLPERLNLEGNILGNERREKHQAWHIGMNPEGQRENLQLLKNKAEVLVNEWKKHLKDDSDLERTKLATHTTLYYLYEELSVAFETFIHATPKERQQQSKKLYLTFLGLYEQHLPPWMTQDDPALKPSHLFACFYQLRRAFMNTFRFIAGSSDPIIALRAAIWESIFSHDRQRYQKFLYRLMKDIPTLIHGPSGSGKELVAQAIGLSRYIPFNDQDFSFSGDPEHGLISMNLSAISPTLIEAELFGHRKGAFTGAQNESIGYLETCPSWGSLFFDEIGDISTQLQVKLLRVLQQKEFQRVGETKVRSFEGKVIAATHRDLSELMEQGKFREDFYFRLCADHITTPSLSEIVDRDPEQLKEIINFNLKAWMGPHDDHDLLLNEIHGHIVEHLGVDYHWPGNFRELEQQIRHRLLRPYALRKSLKSATKTHSWEQIQRGGIPLQNILEHIVTETLLRHQGNLASASRELEVDRRTIKKYNKLGSSDKSLSPHI